MARDLQAWRGARQEMRRLLQEIERDPFESMFSFGDYREALVDVREQDTEFVITAEMPGLDRKDIMVTPTEHGIEIRGEASHEFEEERKGTYHQQHTYAGFYRYLPLPGSAQIGKAKATYKNGLLTVRVPKDSTSAPKRIPVQD